MNLANCLTVLRIILSPLFIFLYMEAPVLGISPLALPLILIGLMTISELSDVLDGYFARRFNKVSDLGKILDPMADSIARISVFLTFTQGPVSLPLMLVLVFLYRDSVVGTLRTICALRGFALAARPSGKVKAVVQAVASYAVLVLMVCQAGGLISLALLHQVSIWIVGAAVVYTVFSGVDYLFANREHIRKLLVA